MIQPIKIQANNTELLDKDFSKIAQNSFIDVEVVIEQQPIALSIGNHLHKGNSYPTSICSYGDFFCLVGASKSRKSFAKKAIVSRYIGGKSNYYCPGIKGHDSENKIIIDNDTEQSSFYVQWGARQVCEMVGFNPDNYKPYQLRALDVDERLGLIEWQFKNIPNIGLMFIDGIADLVKNVNDLDECNAVVQKLMTWTKEYNACLGTIIHKNHGTSKPTGHLGSAVTKKAETVIEVETDADGITTLSPQYCRNRQFENYSFTINEDSLPQELQDINTNHGY